MIGLLLLGAVLAWLVFVVWLAIRVPGWLGVPHRHAAWLPWLLAPVLLVLPFADHVIGMGQFERLCEKETRVWFSPEANATKRGQYVFGSARVLEGYTIQIEKREPAVINLDSGQVVARYNYFSTRGGLLGPTLRLGHRYGCSANDRGHPDAARLNALLAQIQK